MEDRDPPAVQQVVARHADDRLFMCFFLCSDVLWKSASRFAWAFHSLLKRMPKNSWTLIPVLLIFVAAFVVVPPVYLILAPLLQIALVVMAIVATVLRWLLHLVLRPFAWTLGRVIKGHNPNLPEQDPAQLHAEEPQHCARHSERAGEVRPAVLSDGPDLVEAIGYYLQGGMRWSFDAMSAYLKEECPGVTDEELRIAYEIASDPEMMAIHAQVEDARAELVELTTGASKGPLAPPLMMWLLQKEPPEEPRADLYSLEFVQRRDSANQGADSTGAERRSATAVHREFEAAIHHLDQMVCGKAEQCSDVESVVVADLVEAIWYYLYCPVETWSYNALRFQLQAQLPVTDAEVKAAYTIACGPDVLAALDRLRRLKRDLDEIIGLGSIYESKPPAYLDLETFSRLGRSRRHNRARDLLEWPYRPRS